MGTRKSFGPHRREKKFFVVGTKGAGQDYWTFYTSLRFVDRHPGKAKRFYSKKAATAFKAEADGRDNPNMVRVVLKAVETVKGIDIHVPTSAYRKNPGRSQAQRDMKTRRRKYEAPTTIAKHVQAAKRSMAVADFGRARRHLKAALLAHDASHTLSEDGSRYKIIQLMGDLNVAERDHKKPAPSAASRSAKFHRLRAKLLTQFQIAKQRGSFVQEQLIGQKLRKLDRMFYAARTIKRRK
jgi:hypothetical protein